MSTTPKHPMFKRGDDDLCDHIGPCAKPTGCKYVPFERRYDYCDCGGWDEFWHARQSDLRLAGRTNHMRGCEKRDPVHVSPETAEERECEWGARFLTPHVNAGEVIGPFDLRTALTFLRSGEAELVQRPSLPWVAVADLAAIARAGDR